MFIMGHIRKDDLDAIGITILKYGHRKRIIDYANGLYNKKLNSIGRMKLNWRMRLIITIAQKETKN